jgi:Putative prokaryotic signal transducing protein
MTNIDHERERERLAATYAEKSELELAALAGDQRALTEDALRALEAEFVKRGIPFERQGLTIADDADVKLIPIRRFRDLPQALVAKGVLDSAGVKCFLSDENTVRMDWMWSNALGGVRLWVREDDLPDAATLLAPEYSEDADLKQPEE